MWERNTIPNFAEAEDSERVDRSIAFLRLDELIAGLKCAPLNLTRLEYLRAYSNPYVIGGDAGLNHLLQFLWFVSPDFKAGREAMEQFIYANRGLNVKEAQQGIDDYLDRAFLDAPHGGRANVSYYSPSAALVFEMAQEPYRWTIEQTMREPLPIIYQLIKCRDKNNGAVVVNRRSDGAAGDWLDALNKAEEEKREKQSKTKKRNGKK